MGWRDDGGSTSCVRTAFDVERLVELHAPDGAGDHPYQDFEEIRVACER